MSEIRYQHGFVLAATGVGKTQFLQHLILTDIKDPTHPAIVVIDSQSQMLAKIERLKIAKDRLVIIDPSDIWSPALNPFAGHTRAKDLPRNVREQLEAATIDLFNYLFQSIASELTSTQEGAFGFVTKLMLTIPGADLRMLRRLMMDQIDAKDPNPSPGPEFRPHIEALDEDDREFFEGQFYKKTFAVTRTSIARRIRALMQSSSFKRMFGAKENKLDIYSAIQAGKIILFNTDLKLMGNQASSVFGRYAIARTATACFERIALADTVKARSCYLYIDEAHQYFSKEDRYIEDVFALGRKNKLGITFATQKLGDMSEAIRSAALTNCHTKYAAGISAKDAGALATDMRCTSEFLLTTKFIDRVSTEFICYVRNTPKAIKLIVPFGVMERQPSMTDAEYEAMRARNRALYGVADEDGSTDDEPPQIVPDAPQSVTASITPAPRDAMHNTPSREFKRPPSK